MGWTKARFEKEILKFDKHLRVRESFADPNCYLIERKCRRDSVCLRKPAERRGWDAYTRDRDGYTEVMKVRKDLLTQQVFLNLRANDMWQYRGAGPFADELEAQERAAQVRKDAEDSYYLQTLGEEAYDRAMIRQGDIVSGFHSKL